MYKSVLLLIFFLISLSKCNITTDPIFSLYEGTPNNVIEVNNNNFNNDDKEIVLKS